MNYPIVNAIYLLAKKLFIPVESITANCDADTSTVLFYGDVNEEVAKEASLKNSRFICKVIVNSKKTLDLCVPKFVSNSLTKYLINARRMNKVKIRVIIHNSTNLSNLQQLVKNDITVKVINSSILEHEFALVDATDSFKGSAALINCVNYENINYNRDNTMFISEKSVVRSLNKEFERIWESAPYVISEKNIHPIIND